MGNSQCISICDVKWRKKKDQYDEKGIDWVEMDL
jgi:hypothetical protein